MTSEPTLARTIVGEPNRGRLALWDELRKIHLGLDPDPVDRSAPGFGRG